MEKKANQTAGQFAVLGTSVLMSTAGLTIKLLPWNPMVITGIRSIVAVVFLLIVRIVAPPSKNAKNPPVPLFAAAFFFTAMMFCFVIANKLTTSANAVMLQYGAPIWAALLGWALIKEKPHWEHWGALVLIFTGLALFLRDGLGQGLLLGNVIAVFCGFFFGAHSVFLRMLKDGNPADAMLLSHAIGVFVGIPFIVLYPPTLTVPSVIAILYMGIFQIGLASLLFAYGLKRVKAAHAMIIAVAEPLLNPVWVFIVTGETPGKAALAGGVIIVTAVVASTLIGKRREERSVSDNSNGTPMTPAQHE